MLYEVITIAALIYGIMALGIRKNLFPMPDAAKQSIDIRTVTEQTKMTRYVVAFGGKNVVILPCVAIYKMSDVPKYQIDIAIAPIRIFA